MKENKRYYNNPEMSGMDHFDAKDRSDDDIVFDFGGRTISYKSGSGTYARGFGCYLKEVSECQIKINDAMASSLGFETALMVCASIGEKMLGFLISVIDDECYREGICVTATRLISRQTDSDTFDFTGVVKKLLEVEVIDREDYVCLELGRIMHGYSCWHMEGEPHLIPRTGVAINPEHLGEESDQRLRRLCALYLGETLKEMTMELFHIHINPFLGTDCLKCEIPLDREKAMDLFYITLTREKDPEKRLSNIIKCIEYYPGERMFYEAIMDDLETYKDEFMAFRDFWQIDFMFAC